MIMDDDQHMHIELVRGKKKTGSLCGVASPPQGADDMPYSF